MVVRLRPQTVAALGQCVKAYKPRFSPETRQACAIRTFTSSRSTPAPENRIFDSVRKPDEFHTLLLLSSSSNQALITLWKASWCHSCAAVAPIVRQLIEEEGVGGKNGHSVGYTEVEIDAPDMAEMTSRYMVSSIPMLLSFSRQEAQMDTRVTDAEKMKDRKFLTEWIENESARGGSGGAGGSMLRGLFGGGGR